MRILTIILITLSTAILFADPPDWVDIPGDYQYTATIGGGIVLNINGEQIGDEGDMFAAFDNDGNVRGLGLMLFPPFGPYQGTPVFEVQLRSNDAGDILHFQYYDASEDAILEICQTYEFVINDILGNVTAPVEFNIGSFCMSFSNATTSSVNITYESSTAISGFQFDVDGVDVTGASGGAAGDAGFTVSTANNTVVGFSFSGATIPIGSGTLLSLTFEGSSENQTLEVSDMVISDPSGSSIHNSGPGNIEIAVPPELFESNSSTLQALYSIDSVRVNGFPINSDDWVGAFNGNVCVGARKWDTSLCGGGICDVPVMGDDGSELTAGYMNPDDFPTFKIYDASENEYYDAVPNENSPWANSAIYIIELLQTNVSIPGCTDSNYCNYDPLATETDGSCWSANEGCSCADGAGSETDCAGVCNGSSALDNCGVCNGPGSNYECGCADIPEGDCDCLGNVLDVCGVCGGNGVDTDSDGICDDIDDCTGVYDVCGICGGLGSYYECGCADIPDGDCDCLGNVLDECEICNGDGPHFQCQNENVVCNAADCNLDIPLYLLPDECGINKIFPNPFNPVTQIQYEIALYGLVTIRLFDIRGREVDQLIHEYQSPGHYNITWNAGNNASGMYIVELVIQSGNAAIFRDFKKILYLK